MWINVEHESKLRRLFVSFRNHLQNTENSFTNWDDYFRVVFDHFWSKHHFFEASVTIMEIGLSLKPNHHTIIKFSLSKSEKLSAEQIWIRNVFKLESKHKFFLKPIIINFDLHLRRPLAWSSILYLPSISSTLYVRIFRTNVVLAAFSYVCTYICR